MRQDGNRRKMTSIMLSAVLCTAMLTGCTAKDGNTGEAESESTQVGIETTTGAESEESDVNATVTEETVSETAASESADSEAATSESAAEEKTQMSEETEGSYYKGMGDGETIVLDAPPSWDYYLNADKTLPEVPEKLTLTQISAQDNGISMASDWQEQNNLESTDEDEQFIYEIKDGGVYQGSQYSVRDVLEVLPVSAGMSEENTASTLDFSNYVFPDSNPDEEEKAFGEQEVIWAQSVDNILYVATGHYTYASTSDGKNAYITAIDLNDMSVLWRSQPLVCNSRNFTIVKGVIVCGYGFTAEKDYLYELSTANGTVLEQIPLKSGPDQIICKDNIIYVHTYNTDYQFEIG